MAETWDQTTFNKYYYAVDRSSGTPEAVGYGRRWIGLYGTGTFTLRRDRLIAHFGLTPASRILVGGAALGFLVEEFHNAGYLNCWGIDDSPLISTGHPDISPTVILINERVQPGGRIKAILRQETGDDIFDLVITEDVLTCLTDAEIVSEQILFACDGVVAPGGHVVHLVTPLDNPVAQMKHPLLNWKTLPEWRAYLDAQGATSHIVGNISGASYLPETLP